MTELYEFMLKYKFELTVTELPENRKAQYLSHSPDTDPSKLVYFSLDNKSIVTTAPDGTRVVGMHVGFVAPIDYPELYNHYWQPSIDSCMKHM